MKTIKILTLGFVMAASVLTASAQFKNTEDSICKTNRFLYQEAFKSKQYQDAYEPWKIAVATCPKSTKNLYIQGATLLKNLFAQEKDAKRRSELLDELMNMYDLYKIRHQLSPAQFNRIWNSKQTL